MDKRVKQKILQSSAGIIIAVLLFFMTGIRIPVLDAGADAYFNKSITRAGVAYATCRAINGAVSIIKDSKLQLEPAGVGVSLAVGQVLDPVDDMTERLSDVLVISITSLGVQKLAHEISVSLALPVLAVILAVLSLLLWFQQGRLIPLQKTFISFLVFIAIARLCLPVSTLVNDYVHNHFFLTQISKANNNLVLNMAELDKLRHFSVPEIDGALGTIKNSAILVKTKSIQFNNALLFTVNNMGTTIESLLQLTFLYVGMFLIQLIVIPLLSFWFLYKAAISLLGSSQIYELAGQESIAARS